MHEAGFFLRDRGRGRSGSFSFLRWQAFLVDGCDRGCGAPFFFILWQAFGLRDCAVHRLFLVVDSVGERELWYDTEKKNSEND